METTKKARVTSAVTLAFSTLDRRAASPAV